MTFHQLQQGWSGLALGWAVVSLPMVVLTVRERHTQTIRDWVLLPVRSAMALFAYLVVMTVVVTPLVMHAFGRQALQGPGMAAGSVVCCLVAGYAFWRYVNRGPVLEEQLIRGAMVVDGAAVAKDVRALRRRLGPQVVTIAGVPISPLDETKHFKIFGTTGSGKSTAIREMLTGALARGDRAIIADPDGGYLARFYDSARGDLILNPFDPRSVRWNPFMEIRAPYDVDQLARALLPREDEWNGYARTFLGAIVGAMWERKEFDVGNLWRLVAVASVEELRPYVQDSAAQPFLEAENARMFGSVRSVAVSGLAAMRFLAGNGAEFAVRDWVRDGRGVLFLPYTAEQIASLQALIATWLRLGIFQTMGLGEVEDPLERPTWFIVDELDSLGRIAGLKDALARLRKFGGRCVLGFQSISQVSAVYGPGEARTIVENCSSTLILRCSSGEGGGTAKFASELIGEREILRPNRSVSRSREGLPFVGGERESSVTVSHEFRTEAAVLASEIEALPDLAGYLKLASSNAWVGTRLVS